MMRDLAAMPTSIALHLWDALPIILSVIAAVSILASVLLPTERQQRAINLFRIIGADGVIFLIVISPDLALPWATVSLIGAIAVISLNVALSRSSQSAPESREPFNSTWQTLREVVGSTFTQVLVAAVVASSYDLLLRNLISLPAAIWAVLLGGLAMALNLKPGPVAILGASLVVSTGSWTVSTCLLTPIFARELYAQWTSSRRSSTSEIVLDSRPS